MKKLFLVALMLMSSAFALSVEEIQADWLKRQNAKMQEQNARIWQSEDFQRLAPHCQANDKGACEKIRDLTEKHCENGLAAACKTSAEAHAQGNEQFGVSVNLKKAEIYADKVCALDATICAAMSGLFMYLDRKKALKYAEKACNGGEMADCVVAVELYSTGFGGIGKNPSKAKFYADKLCKAGLKEACGF